MTSFSGYINNAVIKLPIHFESHMRIVRQIMNIIHRRFHVFYMCRQTLNVVLFFTHSCSEKILKTTIYRL
jgi:hypothetical protein